MIDEELMPPDFREVYHRYYQPVRSFIAAMVRDQWAADDLAQETFLSAEQNLASLKEPGKLKPWLYRIARNKSLDHFRRVAASREQADERAGEGADPEQHLVQLQLERGEMSSCVREKIDKLPEAYRTVLILFDLAGMSHQEVAEVLEEKEGTVKVRLHRARKALKEILARECAFEMDERNVLVCLPVEDDA
ncbi:MAG: sigma-70 family RNA polymerase sigma factor [Desulfarculaceae bacterium]|nr:sigma-70 family RNA polymerase sigma factor [Desulfarculaceae bacterium]